MDGWLYRLIQRRRLRRAEREDSWYIPCEVCSHPIIRHEIVADAPAVCTVEGCTCGKELTSA